MHTVQGREADVVVLVLGSAADAARARRWAAEKPNLLNVAASRGLVDLVDDEPGAQRRPPQETREQVLDDLKALRAGRHRDLL